MAKGVYVGAPKFELRSLPNGYTQIEYIESNGDLENDGQYINTGIVPETSIFSVEMKVQTIAATTAENWFLTINNNISTTGGANFLNVGTHGGQFRIHLTGITVAGADSVKTDPVDILFTVNGSTASLGGDCNYSVSNNSFQTGPYRNYPIYLMIRSSCRFYSCKIKKNDVLVRDLVPCKNSSGTIGMYDLIGSTFYSNAGSGTFVAGNEPTSVARKVKKMYYGVGNLARKIKRGYIGVGGVARVFYTSEIFDYYGPVTSASESRYCIDTMSTPTHAIFPGNYYGNLNACYTVDAYDANLIHSTPASLSYGHRGCGTGNVGQYGIIAGGYRTDIGSSLNSGVEAYDANLTKVIATAMRSRRTCDGASTPNRVLFAAGRDEDRRELNEVDVYDANLTRSTATGTTFYGNAGDYSCESFNGYAVFLSSVSQNNMNMYNDSLVRTQTTFDNEQDNFSIASNKNYLFLAGGYYDIPDRAMTSRVQVYDKNFVKLNNTNLKDAKMYSGSGFSSSKAAVILPARTFLGIGEYELVPNYDVFDENLVRTNPEFSSLIIGESACASVGGYCVSGLGYVDNGTTVEASTDMVAFTFDG